MKKFPIITALLIAVLAVALAACDSATPTPTPSPPTPTPEPTATPTPTVEPTPTPTLSLEEAIARAEPAVVSLRSGTKLWNGVMIADGIILTTSSNLGQAPVADYKTRSGQEGQAWVIGRDDDMDLALMEVVSGSGPFAFLEVEALSDPTTDQDLVLLQWGPGAASVERFTARVLGLRPDLNTNFRYVQVQAPPGDSPGGLLIDTAGRIRAIRMSEAHMIRIGLGRAGETYGIAVQALANTIVPRLEDGVMVVRQEDDGGGTPGNPPPLPALFRGEVTVGGSPAPVGGHIFARVTRSGQPDLWFSQEITNEGRYTLGITPLTGTHIGGTVEFWYNAKKASQTDTYQEGGNKVVNLTFE